MLYQPKPRTSLIQFAKRVLDLVVGTFAGIASSRADGTYLDGMRGSELEDLGLRRSDDGRYKFFE